MEFAVEMTCQGCVNTVKKSLEGVEGINSVEVQLENERVIVQSSLPSFQIKDLIENTGKRAVLQGSGSVSASKNLGAAVAIMDIGNSLIKGVIRFVQSDEHHCIVEGTIDGLTPGAHTVCVHELGDITRGCESCGNVIGMGITEQVKGMITELEVGQSGRGTFRIDNEDLKVWDLIGRSTIIHEGTVDNVKRDDASNRVVCGIIARSAGLFENDKKICSCDGVSIWKERDVPIAGVKRQAHLNPRL